MFDWLRRKKLPSKQDVEEWFRFGDFTPDVWALEMREFWPLFEYGDVMRNQKLYAEILGEGSAFFGNAFTVEDKYTMWNARKYFPTFPIVLETKKPKGLRVDTTRKRGRIRGEFHMVRPEVIYELDKHRLNGVQFKRTSIMIDIPHFKELKITNQHSGLYQIKVTGELHKHVLAWAYIGNPEFWEGQLDNGFNFPVARLKDPEKSKPFYVFENS